MSTDNNLAERIAEMKAAAEKATLGPWEYANGYVRHRNAQDRVGRTKSYTICSVSSPGANEMRAAIGGYGTLEQAQAIQRANGELIAACNPAAILALIARVEELEREVAELKRLVIHAKVHSGYRDCGYLQMTTLQKGLYDAVWAESVAELDAEDLAQHTATGGGEG